MAFLGTILIVLVAAGALVVVAVSLGNLIITKTRET